MPDFLPRRSAQMVTWSRNFDSVLNAQYESYGISQQVAELYSQLHAAFAEAFQRANDSSTNGDTAMLVKRETEAAARDYARKIGGQIRANPDVSDEQRVILGLRPRRKKPTKPQLPFKPPNLFMKHSAGRTVTIHLRDPESPASRGMPKSAAQAMLYTYVGDTPPATLRAWRLAFSKSRATFKYTFSAKIPAGATVWFTAHWNTRTGQAGMAAAPVSTHVGFAEVALAA